MKRRSTIRSAVEKTGSIVTLWIIALSTACVNTGTHPPAARTFPSDAKRPRPEIVSRRILAEKGGPLDWCAKTNVIAYAYESKRTQSEIYTVNADGSDRRCITCNNELLTSDIPIFGYREKGRFYRTAPAWHPSCEFMVIEIGTPHFKPSLFERSPFALNHGLWLIAADGSWVERIVDPGEAEAAANPHFSDSGDRLFWSTREKTGETFRQPLIYKTPGNENPLDGWYLSIADFEKPVGGSALLSNRVDLYRDDRGWFGATALSADTIWFSRTRDKQRFIDELVQAKVDGTEARAFSLGTPHTWEDQGEPSPWGSLLTYRSSRSYGWQASSQPLGGLRLELWALTREGEEIELTHLNKPVNMRKRAIVRDYSWGPRGREIAIYSTILVWGEEPRHTIEILELNDEF